MKNDRVKITHTEVISKKWYTYKRVDFEYQVNAERCDKQHREVLDRGNGVTILLYNRSQRTVILTRQFRIPTYLNGNDDGLLIETCAGTLENETPLESILRETEEETGIHLKHAEKVFEAYMSPGAVTEKLHFFVAEYDKKMKLSSGGGKPEEHEHIEILEYSFAEALNMIKTGKIKDAKTIMLLQYAQINQLL